MSDRTTYVKGLRALADLLEWNHDLPIPYRIDEDDIGWYVHAIDDALNLQAVMGAPKTTLTDSANFPVDITGTIAGMRAVASLYHSIALAPGQSVTLPALNPLLAAVSS